MPRSHATEVATAPPAPLQVRGAPAPPRPAQHAAVLDLQRLAGNQAVSELLAAQRQDDGARQELEATWQANDGDKMIGEVKAAIADFLAWKQDANRSGGGDLPGGRRAESAVRAFTGNLPQGAGWEGALGGIARQKLTGDELKLLRELDSVSNGTYLATGRDVFLEGAYADPVHRYVMKLSHSLEDDGGSVVQAAESWVMKKLSTRVDITYSNGLGPEWGFARSYTIVGVTMHAGIKLGTTAGDVGKEKAKATAWDWLKDKWKSLTGGEKEAGGEKEGVKPVEGGLGFGVLTLDLEKEGIEADKVGQYWGAPDIEGPVVVARFMKVEAAGGAGVVEKLDYTGIDSIEFAGNLGMPTRLLFHTIGEPKVSAGADVGIEIEIKPAEIGGGYAKLSS